MSSAGYYADGHRRPSGGENRRGGNLRGDVSADALGVPRVSMEESRRRQREESKTMARQVRFGGWCSQLPDIGETTPQPTANRVTGTMADAVTDLTYPELATAEPLTGLEGVISSGQIEDKDVDQLNIRSCEGGGELVVGSPHTRVRVLLPHQRKAIEECSAMRKIFKQAGRTRIIFRKPKKANGSYRARFNSHDPRLNGDMRIPQSPRPGFAIVVRISQDEGTWSGKQFTGTVLVGDPDLGIWFNAVLFAPPDAEAIWNEDMFFGTVEIPDDNTAGGRQNAALFEVETKAHKKLADKSTTVSGQPMDTVSATAASKQARRPDNCVPGKGENTSTASALPEALMATAAKTTPDSLMYPRTPNTTTVPGPPQNLDTHGHESSRRKRPAVDKWNMEEAVARSRRLPAPVSKSRSAFDDM
jgi:hypothetical protein